MSTADDYWDEPQRRAPARPTGPPVTRRNRELAGLAHVIGIFLVTFPVPLFIWLTSGRKSPFVKRHSKEALNFQLNLIGWLAILIGVVILVKDFIPKYGVYLFVLPVLAYLVGAALCLLAGYMASLSEEYRYPM